MENNRDVDLRVFNTAKLFAEGVLFPMMFDYKKFQRQANFGSYDLNNSLQLTEELKDIQRFNGLKGMIETCHDLVQAIASTVKLKGNKEEDEQLKELTETTNKIKIIFYEHKERFFFNKLQNLESTEVLNRAYFDKIRRIIDVCYINTEILMTRNKLLFADTNDEFMSDEEIKDAILREYAEG